MHKNTHTHTYINILRYISQHTCIHTHIHTYMCNLSEPQFRTRRLVNGSRVTTYDSFVEFLTERGGEDVQTATLDFEGKNIVIYGNHTKE